MSSQSAVFLGIDIGTQGVRTLAVNEHGQILAAANRTFSLDKQRQEQSPKQWWQMMSLCLREMVEELKKKVSPTYWRTVSVTSTSGTVLALDQNYQPVTPALMYSDSRPEQEARICREAALQQPPDFGGYRSFHTSSALPEVLWYVRHHPNQAERIHHWVHATDYLIGCLSGVWGISDYTNVLKTGYDLLQHRWPDYIQSQLGLPLSWFPKVVAPGTPLGPVTREAAAATGLPVHLQVTAGMTDGCASQVASGAIAPGEWNTTIGTTLVIKGVTRERVEDSKGRFYSHKHPQGYWMPGGASNTGSDWVSRDYRHEELAGLTEKAEKLTPTPWLAYPLQRKGERFPFIASEAAGFEPESLRPEERFAARMEGVAYLERLAYETAESLSGEKVKEIYTAGGASQNNTWLQIRSSVLNRLVIRMKNVSGAMGAAILSASQSYYSGLQDAVSHLVTVEKQVEPQPKKHEVYQERYHQFLERLRDKGYLAGDQK